MPKKKGSSKSSSHAAKGSKKETNVLIDSEIYLVAQKRVPLEEAQFFKKTGIKARINVSSVINQALRTQFGMSDGGGKTAKPAKAARKAAARKATKKASGKKVKAAKAKAPSASA